MISLELDEDGILVAPAFENGPTPRTWKQCLVDLGEFQSQPDQQQLDEIFEMYGLETKEDLGREVPFDKLCKLITWETPAGAACSLLSSFESDARAREVLDFYESSQIGSGFVGIKLIGTRLEFRRLLDILDISGDAHLPLECEIYATEARTAAAQTALSRIRPDENDDKIDFIEAVPLVEEYIRSGEPELHKFAAMKYGSALAEIPRDSELYRSIATEINATLRRMESNG